MFMDRKMVSERCHFLSRGSVGFVPFISSSGGGVRGCHTEVPVVTWPGAPTPEKEGGGGERGGRPAEAAGVVGSWLY